MRRGSASWLLLAAGLTGCAGPPACMLPSQSPMTVIDLFFGRDGQGGGTVSEAAWADFAASDLTRQFPDGFTVQDAAGQWRDPATGSIGREATRLVVIAVRQGQPDLPARLRAVTEAYKARFRQQAVGVLSTPACGAF